MGEGLAWFCDRAKGAEHRGFFRRGRGIKNIPKSCNIIYKWSLSIFLVGNFAPFY
jgi:hypothetical protein